MRIAFNELELGDDSLYNVTSIEGLDSLPDITIGMAPKPRRHGSWLGGKLAQKRVISIAFEILGDPDDDHRTTKPKNALQNAFQLSDIEQPLIFEMDYGEEPTLVYASVTALDLPIVQNYSRYRRGIVEFTCTDPVKYGAVGKAGTTPPPSIPAATAYGEPYGFAYSESTGTSGTFLAHNAGDSPAPVVYTITGPINQPAITLTDSVGVRRTQFNLALAATDRLVVDTANNSVRLNGTDRFGSAMGALVSELSIRGNGDTTVGFTGEPTGTAQPSLSAVWRDARR